MAEKRLWWPDDSWRQVQDDALWEEPWWERLWEADDEETDARNRRRLQRKQARDEGGTGERDRLGPRADAPLDRRPRVRSDQRRQPGYADGTPD